MTGSAGACFNCLGEQFLDAADYIISLPKKETDLRDWQVVMQALLLVSRSGPTMLARIGVMKALNRAGQSTLNRT